MAVITRTYNIAANWSTNNVLDAIRSALADTGYLGATQTGTVLTFTNTAGTTILAAAGMRYVASTTGGAGTGAVFDVVRNYNTGAVAAVTLLHGGENYAAGNTLTIPGAQIGGVTPADNITVTVSTISGAQGSTTAWYDQEAGTNYTWGVSRTVVDATKKLGQSFYVFHIPAITAVSTAVQLHVKVGPGFQSNTNVINGTAGIDFVNSGPNATSSMFQMTIAKTTQTPLRLISYQSSIDPNFVIFQFVELNINGSVYRQPFYLSKYVSASQPWSLDDYFLSGIYTITAVAASSTVDCAIQTGISFTNTPRRAAEWGYMNGQAGGTRTLVEVYESAYGKRLNSTNVSSANTMVYLRTEYESNKVPNYNPIITGIPVCASMLPIPYVIPSDFGLTEVVDTNTISFGDRVTQGTSQWTVIQYANNLTTNASLAFIAKTQD